MGRGRGGGVPSCLQHADQGANPAVFALCMQLSKADALCKVGMFPTW